MQPRRRSDPGQGSAPPKYPGTFLLAFREAAAGLNWQVRRWKGDSVECADAEGRDRVIGLENLYRRARQAERSDWPELITDFLSTVSSIDPGQGLPGDLEEVAGQLLPRLGPPMAKLPNEAKVWSEPLEGTGLFVNLVVDYPERMAYVTHDLVQDSGRPGSRWLEVALDNLAARTPEGGFHLIDEDSGLRICSVADAYDSSRALLLDRLLPETAAEGCFVSLPGRDALFVLPVSAKALSQVHLLKVLAEKNHQTAPYPISADVFWVRGGVWRQFPIVIKGEEITIEPPEEFLALLDRLVPEKDSSGPDQTSEA